MTFLKICSVTSLLFSLVLIIFSFNSDSDWYLMVFSFGTGIGAFYMLKSRSIGIKVYVFFQVISILYFIICLSSIEQTTIQNAQKDIETEQEKELDSSQNTQKPISDLGQEIAQSVGEAVVEGVATSIQVAAGLALYTCLIIISLIALIIHIHNYYSFKNHFH